MNNRFIIWLAVAFAFSLDRVFKKIKELNWERELENFKISRKLSFSDWTCFLDKILLSFWLLIRISVQSLIQAVLFGGILYLIFM